MKIFLYSFSVYSGHLFLIASAFFRSLPFLGFIVPIFAWNIPLVSLIFLKGSLVFPILFFSSISLHWLLRKVFLFLLAILWNSAFRCLYLSFSSLLFTSLLFTAICKASSDRHFAFFHFVSMGMVLIPVSCTMSWTSVHSSSGTLSIRLCQQIWKTEQWPQDWKRSVFIPIPKRQCQRILKLPHNCTHLTC